MTFEIDTPIDDPKLMEIDDLNTNLIFLLGETDNPNQMRLIQEMAKKMQEAAK